MAVLLSVRGKVNVVRETFSGVPMIGIASAVARLATTPGKVFFYNKRVKAKRFGTFTKCCGSDILDSGKNRCCGTAIKTRSTKYDSPAQKKCCVVNSYREICCGGIKYYRRFFFDFTACCRRRICNFLAHFCCYNKSTICQKTTHRRVL